MPVIFTSKKGTSIMPSVKNKNTLPELIIQFLLRDIGVKYEREKKLLNCRPDIILDIRKVTFIHDCLWHGYDCQRGYLPESNKQFCMTKITKNQERNLRNYTELNKAVWYYLVIWACEIKVCNLGKLIEKLWHYILD